MRKNKMVSDEIEKLEPGWLGLILLVLLLEESNNKANKIWSDFELEIKNENRFFPKAGEEIHKLFEEFSKYAVSYLEIGTFLYRARAANSELLDYIDNRIRKIFDFDKDETTKGLINSINNLNDKERDQLVLEDFWGFNQNGSDAPQARDATTGRANPQGISYLYTSEDAKTAMAEIRPLNKQCISIAKIRVMKRLKLFDFCKVIPDEDGKNFHHSVMFEVISNHFSSPNYCEFNKYYSTQYISEMLKKDYDGIRFNSSLMKDGKNVVLFDTSHKDKNYMIINSSLHIVENICIEEKQILPIRIDN
jgi:hypothetical protein